MKKKLIACLSSLALLAGTAQGMLSATAATAEENNTNPYVFFDYESYHEKSYYLNSDGVIYYQGRTPILEGETRQDINGFDTWIRAPKIVDFSDTIQEIMKTKEPSTKLAVIISPECLEHVAFAEEIAQYEEEHTLNGMTYAEIVSDNDAFQKEIIQFERDNRLFDKSWEELKALFFTAKTGQPTWNKPWTEEDYNNVYDEITEYSLELAEAELAKEPERLKSLGFELQEGSGIRTIATVEQLQNFIPSDRLGYTISLQFLAPTEKVSDISPVTVTPVMSGDTNSDGEIGVMDTVVLHKWLLGIGELPNWKNADLCEDGVINIYDLLKLKQMLIESE